MHTMAHQGSSRKSHKARHPAGFPVLPSFAAFCEQLVHLFNRRLLVYPCFLFSKFLHVIFSVFPWFLFSSFSLIWSEMQCLWESSSPPLVRKHCCKMQIPCEGSCFLLRATNSLARPSVASRLRNPAQQSNR